jgi:hypothetical protein
MINSPEVRPITSKNPSQPRFITSSYWKEIRFGMPIRRLLVKPTRIFNIHGPKNTKTKNTTTILGIKVRVCS